MATIAQPTGDDSDHDNGWSQQLHGINSQASHGQQAKVIIIGAGCTGCTLGQGLLKAGIPCTIYEARDHSKNPGREWCMGLHWAALGLKSLLPDHIWARLPSTQVDPNYQTGNGEEIPFFNGSTGQTIGVIKMDKLYRVHRPRLRSLLSEGLDIREAKSLTDLTYSLDDQTVSAHFVDGTTDTGHLLIGTDGARSSVRTLLLGADAAKTHVLDSASTMCFTRYTREQALFLRDPPDSMPFQVSPHPAGYFAVLGLHDAPDPDRPDEWTFLHYISFPEPAAYVNERTTVEHAAHQKQLAKLFAGRVGKAFEWMGDDGRSNAWYGKLNHWDPGAEGHRWDNRGGRVTLAGDAAHPMTFQRGQGLNHAIADAVALRDGIVGAWKVGRGCQDEERTEMMERYKDDMVRRAGEEVRLSAKNTQMLHDWEMVMNSPVVKSGLNQRE